MEWKPMKGVNDGWDAMPAGRKPAHEARFGAVRVDYLECASLNVGGNLSQCANVLDRGDVRPHVSERNDVESGLGRVFEQIPVLRGEDRKAEASRIERQSSAKRDTTSTRYEPGDHNGNANPPAGRGHA
jgi:hypothetical protein